MEEPRFLRLVKPMHMVKIVCFCGEEGFIKIKVAFFRNRTYNKHSYPEFRVCGCKSMPVAGETIHISWAKVPVSMVRLRCKSGQEFEIHTGLRNMSKGVFSQVAIVTKTSIGKQNP